MTEWNGAWCDGDKRWTTEIKQQIEQQLREKLNWEAKDDGVFFMPFEAFTKYFTDL